MNSVPSAGTVNSPYQHTARSNQTLSLVGMAVDNEGDEISVSMFMLH